MGGMNFKSSFTGDFGIIRSEVYADRKGEIDIYLDVDGKYVEIRLSRDDWRRLKEDIEDSLKQCNSVAILKEEK